MSEFEADLVAHLHFLRGAAVQYAPDQHREDLVQDTIVRALRYRGSFAPGTNFRQWLKTIMRNEAIDQWRRRRFEVPSAPEDFWSLECLSTAPDEALFVVEVAEAVDRLKPRFREMLIFAAEGHAQNETAAEVNVALGVVKSRTSRARAALQEALS